MNAAKSTNQSEITLDAQALKGLQVLLAEDCPDQGRLYLKFLQSADALVTLECTGQSAVDTISKSIDSFDAVVMDFQMPELDGIEATRLLLELGYQGIVIAVIAHDSNELRETWFQAGCTEFLRKPIKRDELLRAILSHTENSQNSL